MLGLHSKGNDLSNTCPDSSLGMSIAASKWEDVYNLGTKSNVGGGLEATESRLWASSARKSLSYVHQLEFESQVSTKEKKEEF